MKNNKLEHINPKKNQFKTPEGYFDSIEDAVFTNIAEEKLPKKEGFNVPDSYFDTIENKFFNKLTEEKSNNGNGFTTPENYFETLEDNILTTLNKKQPKVIHLRSLLVKKIIPIAAAASLLLLLYINYNNSYKNINNVATSDIENWIDNDLIFVDAYEIADVYNDVELTNDQLYTNDDAVLEYLNGTDVETLLLENQ